MTCSHARRRSVAVGGFAFEDILQNLLAGLLLLIRRPYRRDDQIVARDFEGTVEQIESRATLIKTYEGRRVMISNSDIYTSPVIVDTAFDQRRDEYVVGIRFADDIARAVDVFAAAMRDVPGVLAEPAPEVLPWKLNDATVDLKLRWWAKSMRLEQVHVRADVVLAVYLAAKREEIDLPFPTTVMLLHDQTEETNATATATASAKAGRPRDRPCPCPQSSSTRSGLTRRELSGQATLPGHSGPNRRSPEADTSPCSRIALCGSANG